jgi:alpha-beta hydrolase superfamily lysophospholipase
VSVSLQGTSRAVTAGKMLTIAMPDGIEIVLRVIEPAGEIAATALVLHGNGLHSGYYVPFAKLLATHGVRLVLMDRRGHGMSGGERGHVDVRTQYADDLVFCLGVLRDRFAGPLFALAHSVGAAILLKASRAIAWHGLAGVALFTPTFFGDASLIRRGCSSWCDTSALRYLLRTRATPALQDEGHSKVVFDRRAFLLFYVLGIGRRRPVITHIPTLSGEQPYTYTAAALCGSMIAQPEQYLAQIPVPVFLATGDDDVFVDGAAVQSVVPWALGPHVPLTSVSCVGGNHFTTLLHAVRPLSSWLIACTQRVI